MFVLNDDAAWLFNSLRVDGTVVAARYCVSACLDTSLSLMVGTEIAGFLVDAKFRGPSRAV